MFRDYIYVGKNSLHMYCIEIQNLLNQPGFSCKHIYGISTNAQMLLSHTTNYRIYWVMNQIDLVHITLIHGLIIHHWLGLYISP